MGAIVSSSIIRFGNIGIAMRQVIHISVQVHAVVGVLSDDTDPMVTVLKLKKAPTESYADIGGQIQRDGY